ncbi:MAG: RHS repeat protein [Chloroflexi bacterium]|nr:RHS repeat protein [Chloroflexota bacterium]
MDSTLYLVQTSYDDADRVATITYPNGEVVTYRYGDHGLPVALESSTQGKIVNSVSYNALGKPFDLALGNGLTTSYRYWGLNYGGNTHYGLIYSIATGSHQNLTYSDYDAVCNVKQINDVHNNETISFGYDHLDRLTSASSR